MKIKTGIPGLDKLLDGGVPEHSILLLSGSAGTGKTIFSLQFLLEGIKKKERALFITFEETEDKIRDQAASFGWDLEKAEKQGLFKISTLTEVGIVNILQSISQNIDSFKPQRMGIDSVTFMALSAYSLKHLVDLEKTSLAEVYEEMAERSSSSEHEDLIVRKVIVDFVKVLQKREVTTILTSEIPRESIWLSRDTFTEFACDGVILLKATSIGSDLHRTLEVIKMRNIKIKGGVYSFDFEKSGIKINV